MDWLIPPIVVGEICSILLDLRSINVGSFPHAVICNGLLSKWMMRRRHEQWNRFLLLWRSHHAWSWWMIVKVYTTGSCWTPWSIMMSCHHFYDEDLHGHTSTMQTVHTKMQWLGVYIGFLLWRLHSACSQLNELLSYKTAQIHNCMQNCSGLHQQCDDSMHSEQDF